MKSVGNGVVYVHCERHHQSVVCFFIFSPYDDGREKLTLVKHVHVHVAVSNPRQTRNIKKVRLCLVVKSAKIFLRLTIGDKSIVTFENIL